MSTESSSELIVCFQEKRCPCSHLEEMARKRDTDSMKQLDELVEELLEECAFPQVAFDAQAIRQHILAILNERRRSVRKGHDYTKVN